MKTMAARLGALLCGAAVAAALPLGAHAEDKVITEWDLQTTPGAVAVIRDAEDRFEKDHPGFKVEDSHILNDAYKAKLKIAFGAGEPPCVFSSWGGGPLREYVNADQVVDLTPYLDQHPEFKDRFATASFGAATTDGKIYALPAENTAVAAIFYNKDIFKRLNLTPPKTWDELMATVKTLNDNNIAPFALANKNKWPGSMFFVYLVDRIGGPEAFAKAVDPAADGSFTDEPFIEAGKRIQELVKADAFARGYNGLDYDIGGSRRLLYSGRAAMELMGSWELATIRNENPDFVDKLGVFAFPAVEGGKGDPNNLVGTLGDNFISISKACPYKDEAFDLLMKLTDDTAAAGRLADKRVMPLKNLKVEDPFLKTIVKMVGEAPSVQLWYDQELAPALGEAHKDTTQALFGLSMTPEEAAAKMEEVAKSAH
ncbi:extracellular solute-binding protein [Consotaella salsifontis]|uniref:Carbohydrate ABC transporter substrate-binding protein, CUT1 family n=1 Tax=Consotaella salsifontis TaxID=1365950 RepID=A0A1T4QER2_9HYPH|nr:extracellular solute-binding protein [Consotaella salsifontis]SKA02229.1 carbohydrate ABC transporter substrate-binding protein, CUT1 family [Consotaella salsifontis]